MKKKNKDEINVYKQIEGTINMQREYYQGYVPKNCFYWINRNKEDRNNYDWPK